MLVDLLPRRPAPVRQRAHTKRSWTVLQRHAPEPVSRVDRLTHRLGLSRKCVIDFPVVVGVGPRWALRRSRGPFGGDRLRSRSLGSGGFSHRRFIRRRQCLLRPCRRDRETEREHHQQDFWHCPPPNPWLNLSERAAAAQRHPDRSTGWAGGLVTRFSWVADGVGFEPTEGLHLRRFSRPVPSTTRPPVQVPQCGIAGRNASRSDGVPIGRELLGN